MSSNVNVLNEYISDNLNNMYRFAFLFTRNQHDAEDIVCESVYKALASIKDLKNSGSMKSWIYTIIANTAKTFVKRQSKICYMDDTSDLFEENNLVDELSDISFKDIIESLPAEERAIVVLRYCEDYKIKDIAEILKINENTVKKRLYTAHLRLKSMLGGDKNE